MIKKILFGGESGLSPFANIGSALLRIFAGVALMFGHGACDWNIDAFLRKEKSV